MNVVFSVGPYPLTSLDRRRPASTARHCRAPRHPRPAAAAARPARRRPCRRPGGTAPPSATAPAPRARPGTRPARTDKTPAGATCQRRAARQRPPDLERRRIERHRRQQRHHVTAAQHGEPVPPHQSVHRLVPGPEVCEPCRRHDGADHGGQACAAPGGVRVCGDERPPTRDANDIAYAAWSRSGYLSGAQ